jgi:hypothetical protein
LFAQTNRMRAPIHALRDILSTGNTHPDFFAMCDLLENNAADQGSVVASSETHFLLGPPQPGDEN